MPRVIVFDVNETLLDLGALESHFEQMFGDGSHLAGMVCERPALFGSGNAGWPVLRLREYRRSVTRHGRKRSRHHTVVGRPQPHPAGYVDATCPSRCAGGSSDDAKCGAEARYADELGTSGGSAAAHKCRPDHLLRALVLCRYRASLQTSRRGVPVGRRLAWASHRSPTTGSSPCLGCDWRAPGGIHCGLRCPTGEGPLPARSQTGYQWPGF